MSQICAGFAIHLPQRPVIITSSQAGTETGSGPVRIFGCVKAAQFRGSAQERKVMKMKHTKRILAICAAALMAVSAASGASAATRREINLQAAANACAKTVQEVLAERIQGKTFGAIAAEAGMLEEFQAERLALTKADLDQQVKDGIITQEEADQSYQVLGQRLQNCTGTGNCVNNGVCNGAADCPVAGHDHSNAVCTGTADCPVTGHSHGNAAGGASPMDTTVCSGAADCPVAGHDHSNAVCTGTAGCPIDGHSHGSGVCDGTGQGNGNGNGNGAGNGSGRGGHHGNGGGRHCR